eukprot:TRINITY_DN30423_c0_g2_i1.p1 TRINITY_DN30423_c0_g2~~TRINITY_DN30423_c0_g2_i1.p1  ORF type:complete len:144 (-),score=30.19 TRINITY_DN30423_c0_g2_i1:40-471(-)
MALIRSHSAKIQIYVILPAPPMGKRSALLTVLISVALVSRTDGQVGAVGDHEGPDIEETMKQVDKNRDGKMSWREMAETMGEHHPDPAKMKEMMRKGFMEADTNADKFISMEEMKGLFEIMDRIVEAEIPAEMPPLEDEKEEL